MNKTLLLLATGLTLLRPIVSWSIGVPTSGWLAFPARNGRGMVIKTNGVNVFESRSGGGMSLRMSKSATVVDQADQWVRQKTFGELLDKQELRNLANELSKDDAYSPDFFTRIYCFHFLRQKAESTLRL